MADDELIYTKIGMVRAGDIVTRLRHVAWLAEEGSEVTDLAATAADEIDRLRAAGDLLGDKANHAANCAWKWYGPCDCGLDIALTEWLEARRG